MIRNDEDFKRVIQARIAPVCFYPRCGLLSYSGVKHGTMTFFKNAEKVFGITNAHVFEDYETLDTDKILQIGNFKIVNLAEREEFRSNKQDIIVLRFNEQELKLIGDKGCFRILENISELYHKYSEQFKSVEQTALHLAGFQEKLSKPNFEIEFQIFLTKISTGSVTEDNITLRFSDIRDAINAGKIKPELGALPVNQIDFGGISGCPVFAKTSTNRFDFSLLGIVYEGHGNSGLLPEAIFARPIGLIKDILTR